MGPRHKTENCDDADAPSSDSSDVIDAIMDHVALEHAESAEVFTPEEDRWARGVRQRVDQRLAELRQQLAPAQARSNRLPPIPHELLALDRAGLLEHLASLQQSSDVRYAEQDLTGLSCDELRQMIAAIPQPPTEE